MASNTTEYNTFIKGIITEASPLTFPENASIDEENFTLLRDGSRQRRLGMDYEGGFVQSTNILNSTFEDLAVHTSEWRNADNSPENNFSVVQIGTTIYFYNLSAEALSADLKTFEVDLSTYKTAYATNIGGEAISTTVGKGNLYVVSEDTNPFYIEYDGATDSINIVSIDIKIRDFLGVDDGLDVDERPTTLSVLHEYNLLNHGWSSTDIASFFSSIGTYPSNADLFSLGKDASDNFSPTLLEKQYFGNTPATGGHFLLDVFNRDRDTASGLVGLVTELEHGRPSSTAFYAGRVFYAGVTSNVNAGPTLNGNIYFSRSLVESDLSGEVNQEADPTAEAISDLIDTDGGVITIPEIGVIHKLVAVRDSLVVFADNGVWQILGDGSFGFAATSFQVQKISNVGSLNEGSVVSVESVVFYWTVSGIYIVQPDPNSGFLNSTNITETTIQTLYLEIPSVSKLYSKGVYDVASKRISWLYNDSDGYDGGTSRFNYTKELVFDFVLRAFYKNSISSLATNSPYVAGVVTTPDLIASTTAFNVIANGLQVTAGGEDVQVSLPSTTRGSVATKYLIVTPQDSTNSKVTWGLYKNNSFMDWETADGTGVTYSSFLRTGWELFQDTMRRKYTPYLVAHFKRTETGFIDNGGVGLDAENPSSCLMQAKWGWSDSDNSGKWSVSQQLYRLKRLYIPTGVGDTFDYGWEVVSTKSKMRGNGKSVSLHFTSETGKDMHLLGWGVAGVGSMDV